MRMAGRKISGEIRFAGFSSDRSLRWFFADWLKSCGGGAKR